MRTGRMTRVDRDGVPKIVQWIQACEANLTFRVWLYDGTFFIVAKEAVMPNHTSLYFDDLDEERWGIITFRAEATARELVEARARECPYHSLTH